ncbi:hypothetical protein D3C85_1849320 [compost metagenome]
MPVVAVPVKVFTVTITSTGKAFKILALRFAFCPSAIDDCVNSRETTLSSF